MNNKTSKLVGIIVILLGLNYLALQTGFLNTFVFGTTLTCIIYGLLIAIGLSIKSYPLVILGVGFGYYFTQDTLHLPEVSFSTMLIVTGLLLIGFSLIFPHKPKFNKSYSSDSGNDLNVILSESEKYVNDSDFKSLSSSCLIGEAKIFLSDAIIQSSEAHLDIRTIIGTTTLFVPKNWEVQLQVTTVMGESKITGQFTVADKKIIVHGSTIMGELQIIYI